jgi:hypothetical protein
VNSEDAEVGRRVLKLRYYLICLEGLRNTIKINVRILGFRDKIRTPVHRNIREGMLTT